VPSADHFLRKRHVLGCAPNSHAFFLSIAWAELSENLVAEAIR
jgi:hypothetical protein